MSPEGQDGTYGVRAPFLELTREEKDFIRNLLGQLQIRPAQPDAEEVVRLVRSILQKIEPEA